jgi:hypothetical protein
MDSFLVLASAIGPRMKLTETFIHIEGIPRAINRVKGRERGRRARVMARVLDRVVIVGTVGEVKRQVCVKEIVLELNTRLLLLISSDANIKLGRCSPHVDVRGRL